MFFVDCGVGSDADGDGSLCHPFMTVQRCVYRLRGLDANGTAVGGMTQAPAGSECRLRDGVCSMEHDIHGDDNYILIEHLVGEQGKPFIIVNIDCNNPKFFPALPLINSAGSGFFF